MHITPISQCNNQKYMQNNLSHRGEIFNKLSNKTETILIRSSFFAFILGLFSLPIALAIKEVRDCNDYLKSVKTSIIPNFKDPKSDGGINITETEQNEIYKALDLAKTLFNKQYLDNTHIEKVQPLIKQYTSCTSEEGTNLTNDEISNIYNEFGIKINTDDSDAFEDATRIITTSTILRR